MRITSNSFPTSLIAQLQRLTGKVATLQNQAATGQRITQPSDDPAAAVRVLNFQAERARLAQYQRNAGRAGDIVNASVAQVRNLVDISNRATEVMALSSDVNGAEGNRLYGTEINQLLEQSLVSANARFNDEPLFGGTTANAQPFVATRDGSGQITAITYTGAAAGANFQISGGSRISPFTDGSENGQIRDFLNNLVALRDGLATGSADNVKAVAPALEGSENALINLLSGRGALQQRLEVETTQNNARYGDLALQVSREADADLAQTIVELTQQQTAYQAALMSSGKILNHSLLNYI